MEKDIKDRVKSYEDACKVLGEQPITDFGDATPDEIAYKKLKTIVKALNGEWEPDYKNSQAQQKWYLCFSVKPSGFTHVCFPAYMHPNLSQAVLFCFKSEKLANYAGTQFLNLWEKFILRA